MSLRTAYLFLLTVLFSFSAMRGECVKGNSIKTETVYQYDLAVAAIFQNEGPYLKEWIEFHKLVGAQHFYLFNNRSTDEYMTVLQPYIEAGEVDLIDWPGPASDEDILAWRQCQNNAYAHAISFTKGKVRWLAVIDLDEFLFPVDGDNLLELLEKEYSKYAGVCVNWQMYGTSKIKSLPKNTLMIESLTYRAKDDYYRHHTIKSIVRPEFVKSCDCAHYFKYKPGYFHVNTHKEKQPLDKTQTKHIYLDKMRINHYWTRDEDYYWSVKVPRWEQKFSEGFFEKRLEELHQVEDKAIFKYIPALKKAMGLP